MIYSLAPQYVMYGSQKYLVQVRNYVLEYTALWMCSQICISVAELQLRWSLLIVVLLSSQALPAATQHH